MEFLCFSKEMSFYCGSGQTKQSRMKVVASKNTFPTHEELGCNQMKGLFVKVLMAKLFPFMVVLPLLCPGYHVQLFHKYFKDDSGSLI